MNIDEHNTTNNATVDTSMLSSSSSDPCEPLYDSDNISDSSNEPGHGRQIYQKAVECIRPIEEYTEREASADVGIIKKKSQPEKKFEREEGRSKNKSTRLPKREAVLKTVQFSPADEKLVSSTQHPYAKKASKNINSYWSTTESGMPVYINRFGASDTDKKRIPNILYWQQQDHGEPYPVLGPPVTPKEEYQQMLERRERKKQRNGLAATRKEINNGDQAQIKDFFPKKKRSRKTK